MKHDLMRRKIKVSVCVRGTVCSFKSPVCEEVKEVIEEKMEEVKGNNITPPRSVRKVMEEDLEDWLDTMIS